ncbi:MAG: type II and III secretion system protein family protein, partial [Alphaproteobacteria bacterium]|nr:type II and III secretion system protein family protein [Alphaproteobacteria bacterium]
AAVYGPGHLLFPSDSNGVPMNTQGIFGGVWRPNGPGGFTLGGALQALERDGLFKLLAEPNLVAISGEQAEFLAGGEIPIPVPQTTGVGASNITIEYKPYGVAVRFKPFVLTENRIRMDVQPEVSELDPANALQVSGFSVPALTTRRAKTTVELAPGESFMIAGLLKDQSQSTIDQLPGVKELPILGALFRSTNFQRNETELVIAVTPYLADPVKSNDIKLPTDNFMPASQMEMIFYGALGSLTGDAARISQTPSVEGPIGFMVD